MYIVLLLGLVGSGKTTYSDLIQEIISSMGIPSTIIDGDILKGLTSEEVLKLGENRNPLTQSAIIEEESKGKVVILSTGGGALYCSRNQDKNIFDIWATQHPEINIHCIIPCVQDTSEIISGKPEDYPEYVSHDPERIKRVCEQRGWNNVSIINKVCENNKTLQPKLLQQLDNSGFLKSLTFVPMVSSVNREEIMQSGCLRYKLGDILRSIRPVLPFDVLVLGQRRLVKIGDQFKYIQETTFQEPSLPELLPNTTNPIGGTKYTYEENGKTKWDIVSFELNEEKKFIVLSCSSHKYSDMPTILRAIQKNTQEITIPTTNGKTMTYNLSSVEILPCPIEVKGEFLTFY
jgi:shikimate kinase